MNPPFQELIAVIKVKLTLSISLFKMQLQARQSHFKSEYLFRTFSVATNLVTSPKSSFRLLRYYAVPFWPTTEQFSHFQSYCSAVTSSATSEYRTVPERPSRNEEQSSIDEERTRNTPSSGPNIIQIKRSKITWTF